MPPAGRPREFDENEVLSRALGTFWSRGYDATSLSDLVEATGLAKGSLYQAFGDKHALFLRSLTAYLETARKSIREIILAPYPKGRDKDRQSRRLVLLERLRQLFLGSVQHCQVGQVRRGCFAVNSLTELVPRDPDVAALVNHHFAELERYLAAALAQMNDPRDASSPTPEQITTAKLLQVVLTGLLVLSKGPLGDTVIEGVVERALTQLL